MVDKFILLKDVLIEDYNRLTESPELCIFLFILFFFVFYLWVNVLTESLFDVHRSKTAVRKIMKEYSFLQKALRTPHKTHCLHAKKFCIKIINYLYIHALFFAIGLIIMITECILSEKMTVSVCIFITQILAFVAPMFVSEIILHEFPMRRGYKFEKYHHTKEFEKLT